MSGPPPSATPDGGVPDRDGSTEPRGPSPAGAAAAEHAPWHGCTIDSLEGEAHRELVRWLSPLPWQWFITMTWPPMRDTNVKTPHARTPKPRRGARRVARPRSGPTHNSLEYCQRRVRTLLGRLSRKAWGPRWAERHKGLFGVMVYERHKEGAWHAHGLLAGVRDLRRMDVVDYCAATPGYGWTRVFDFADERQVAYLVKYVAKNPGLMDIVGIRWFEGPSPEDLFPAATSEGGSAARDSSSTKR